MLLSSLLVTAARSNRQYWTICRLLLCGKQRVYEFVSITCYVYARPLYATVYWHKPSSHAIHGWFRRFTVQNRNKVRTNNPTWILVSPCSSSYIQMQPRNRLIWSYFLQSWCKV